MAPLLPQQSVYGWSHPYITEDDVHIVLYTLRDYDSHAINSRKGSNACRSITYYDRILHFLSNRSRSSLFLSLSLSGEYMVFIPRLLHVCCISCTLLEYALNQTHQWTWSQIHFHLSIHKKHSSLGNTHRTGTEKSDRTRKILRINHNFTTAKDNGRTWNI